MSPINTPPDKGLNSKSNKPLLVTRFKEVLREEFPFLLMASKKNGGLQQYPGLRPVLLAISGGMDSMVLGRLLFEIGMPAIWVHCNFSLRGKQSDRDEAFVRKQAALLDIPLIVKTFDTTSQSREWKMSIEETARKLRYDFFASLIKEAAPNADLADLAPLSAMDPELRPRYLMTAHHAQDNIETLLLNFFRGTGISGMHGMPQKNDYILRPLLSIRKKELLDYTHQKSLEWVEDATNQLTDYTRNYLRHEILPALKKQYPAIEDNLLDNIQRFKQTEVLYHKGLQYYKKRLFNFMNGQLHLSVLLLQKSGIAATLLWEALKPYGFGSRQIFEVEKLLIADSGAYQDNPAGTFRVLRNRAHLVVTALSAEKAGVVVIEKVDAAVDFPEGNLILKLQNDGQNKSDIESDTDTENKNDNVNKKRGAGLKIIADPTFAQLDLAMLTFPLLLRKWKPGDYFYPLGMHKKKKVARFLIDQKVGLHEKEHIWVLESQQRIVWLIGWRIDERFKITPKTKNVLKLHFKDHHHTKRKS